jgi:enoyl-CoA hydratase/carnithine racemase
MTYQEIRYAVENRVATITLDRPDFLNAWTLTMEGELRDAMTAATRDDGVRVIMVTGEGRGFCAGADMSMLADVQEGGGDSHAEEAPNRPGPVDGGLELPEDFGLRYTYFPTVPKPIVAAINGPCAGLGLVMALYSDIRIASDTAKFTTAFSRRGLIAEHGTSWMLPRLVGLSTAFDLLLSARKFTAPEALAMGLVSQVYPAEQFRDAARDYAADLADNVSPRSMRVMKKQLYRAQFQTLDEAVAVANEEMVLSFDCEDFAEGVAHFVDKRPARFTGR